MMYKTDPMLKEIWQIKKQMWEESGHNPHISAENIRRIAKKIKEDIQQEKIEHNYMATK